MSILGKMCCVLVLFSLCAVSGAPARAAEEVGASEHHPHVGMDEKTSTDLLDFKTDLAIYTFIIFILLMLILWKTAFGPISKALHNREEGIRKSIDEAKSERLKAEELRGEYEGMLEAAEDKVRAIYAEANAKADEMRTRRIAEANQEAQDRIKQAVQEIERAKDHAIAELFEKENERIVQATEHVLGRALSDDDQHRLVNEALSHFSKT